MWTVAKDRCKNSHGREVPDAPMPATWWFPSYTILSRLGPRAAYGYRMSLNILLVYEEGALVGTAVSMHKLSQQCYFL